MENTKRRNEDYGFFGKFYMEGDNSQEGYLISKKQNLTERTETEVHGVINLLNLKGGEKILDCPCGYGRHSIELAKKGYNITGIDLNSNHLDVAKEKAQKENLKIDRSQQNMIDIKYNSEFDSIINMFYSFGFFEKDEDNIKVLQKFYNALKPKGKFLMHTDVNIPFIESGQYKHDENRPLKNGKTLRIVDTYNPHTKRVEGLRIIQGKNGEKIEKRYSVRVYTREEFIELCKMVGFKRCTTYSDREKISYSTNSEDMIIIAEK